MLEISAFVIAAPLSIILWIILVRLASGEPPFPPEKKQ